jgi:hypothetical protein
VSVRASPAAALFLLLASLTAPAAVRGQGLGDAATRERQKRHKEAPARVYTNEDLESKKGSGASQGSAAAEAGSAGAAPADGGHPAASAAGPGPAGEAQPSDPLERERHERTLLEAEWRMRFKDAREELARAEAAAWTEGYKIEFHNGQPVQVRTRERVLTDELKRARQALAELEEEFRRTGLPAGWARE